MYIGEWWCSKGKTSYTIQKGGLSRGTAWGKMSNGISQDPHGHIRNMSRGNVRILSASCLSKTLGVVYRRPFVDWQRRRVDVCRCAMSSAIRYVVAFFDVYSRRLYDVSVNLRTKPAVTISLLTYTSQLRSMYFAAARTINFIYKT